MASNSANKLVWWLLGLFAAATFSLGAAWGKSVERRLSKNEGQNTEIIQRLTRIETKLDQRTH